MHILLLFPKENSILEIKELLYLLFHSRSSMTTTVRRCEHSLQREIESLWLGTFGPITEAYDLGFPRSDTLDFRDSQCDLRLRGNPEEFKDKKDK